MCVRFLICCLLFASVAVAQDATAPFPGKKGDWNGFDKYEFPVGGKTLTVVAPKEAAAGKPWVWHGEFFGHKPAPDVALLKRGFHAVYLSVPNMLGSPAAVEHWNAAYKELTEKHGFAKKVALVGLSRGGLYVYNWAAANPDKVACIYADAAVCDFKSWPGGKLINKGAGKGSAGDWKLVLQQWGFKDDAEAIAYTKNPVDNLAPLAKANVPLLHVYGDADDVVPWDENTGVIAERYKKLGGDITLIAKKGVGHHPHGLEDPTPIVEFIYKHAAPVKDSDGARGKYFKAEYEPSTKEGELPYGVTYTVWLPPRAKKIRGVIVHQHGCGSGACQGGATAAYDLHWQALAAKWDCALLGPSYHQEDKQNCRLWCDPRNGSEKTFLRALADLVRDTGHAELATAPWCLWGHSGGGFWASVMQARHPERIVAIWYRSGTAFATWEKGEIEKPELTPAVYQIPIVLNPGVKENADPRFSGAWTGAKAMFAAYRAQGSPACFAPDPRTGHECGDCRYLAIPFFDACLAARLPDVNAQTPALRSIDLKDAWFAKLEGDTAQSAADFKENAAEANWLPNERVARAWMEYVKTGAVSDATEPPPPSAVVARRIADDHVELTWSADADFESGIQGFVIERDGKEVARLPPKPVGKFGRPLFQTMSYHDTPEKPLPDLRYIDTIAGGTQPKYRVLTINGVGLLSTATDATTK